MIRRRRAITILLIILCLTFSYVHCKKKKKSKTNSDIERRDGHTEEPAFKCPRCSKAFKTESQLVQHMRDKHGISPSSAKEEKQKRHERNDKYRDQDVLKCPQCPKTFKSEAQLRQHMRDKHGILQNAEDLPAEQFLDVYDQDVYKCTRCSKTFPTEAQLRQHMQDKHGILPSKKERRNSEEDFKTDNDIKSRAFTCEICSETFQTLDRLLQHKRDAHGISIVPPEKKEGKDKHKLEYECPVCKKKFKSEKALKQHQQDKNHIEHDASKTRAKHVLHTFHTDVRVDEADRKDSIRVVKETIDSIFKKVRELDGGKIFSPSVRKAGSMAAKTKIGKADEFDYNIPLNVECEDIRTDGMLGYVYEDKKFDREDGSSPKNMNIRRKLTDDTSAVIPRGQAALRIRANRENSHLLYKGDILPFEVLQDLYRKLREAISDLDFTNVHLHREAHGPALTLTVKQSGDHDISVDLTLSITCESKMAVSDGGWPRPETTKAFSDEQIEAALDAGMHFVPKFDETWAISYSKAERAIFEIIDKGHQCRRRVMQMLKRHVQICTSRSRDGFPGISSHIVKNQLLWSIEKRSNDNYWNEKNIDVCLLATMDDLIESLRIGYLPNFFDESENVLAGKREDVRNRLANCLAEEREARLLEHDEL